MNWPHAERLLTILLHFIVKHFLMNLTRDPSGARLRMTAGGPVAHCATQHHVPTLDLSVQCLGHDTRQSGPWPAFKTIEAAGAMRC